MVNTKPDLGLNQRHALYIRQLDVRKKQSDGSPLIFVDVRRRSDVLGEPQALHDAPAVELRTKSADNDHPPLTKLPVSGKTLRRMLSPETAFNFSDEMLAAMAEGNMHVEGEMLNRAFDAWLYSNAKPGQLASSGDRLIDIDSISEPKDSFNYAYNLNKTVSEKILQGNLQATGLSHGVRVAQGLDTMTPDRAIGVVDKALDAADIGQAAVLANPDDPQAKVLLKDYEHDHGRSLQDAINDEGTGFGGLHVKGIDDVALGRQTRMPYKVNLHSKAQLSHAGLDLKEVDRFAQYAVKNVKTDPEGEPLTYNRLATLNAFAQQTRYGVQPDADLAAQRAKANVHAGVDVTQRKLRGEPEPVATESVPEPESIDDGPEM